MKCFEVNIQGFDKVRCPCEEGGICPKKLSAKCHCERSEAIYPPVGRLLRREEHPPRNDSFLRNEVRGALWMYSQ
jgi:hypothetical protein